MINQIKIMKSLASISVDGLARGWQKLANFITPDYCLRMFSLGSLSLCTLGAPKLLVRP